MKVLSIIAMVVGGLLMLSALIMMYFMIWHSPAEADKHLHEALTQTAFVNGFIGFVTASIGAGLYGESKL